VQRRRILITLFDNLLRLKEFVSVAEGATVVFEKEGIGVSIINSLKFSSINQTVIENILSI
jgi:hypothetical protein